MRTSLDARQETLYPKAHSYYMGAEIPGKPRVFMLYSAACAVTARS